MKQCPNCGVTYPDDLSFCIDCGTPLVEAAPPPEFPSVSDAPTIQLSEPGGEDDSSAQAAPNWEGDPSVQPAPGWEGDPSVQPAPGWEGDPSVQPAPGWEGDPSVQPAPNWEGDPSVQPAPNWEGDPSAQPAPGWQDNSFAQPAPNWEGVPYPAAPAPMKKSKAPVIVAVVLAVCTVLAAACAGVAGYQAFQFKKNYESEQALRATAEKKTSDVQKELDALQTDYDKATDDLKNTNQQLEDTQQQLEDTRRQLADVNSQLNSGSSRLDAVQQELSGLIDLLDDGGYGFASTKYYASKGVVVLSRYSSETISIYESYSGSQTFTFHTPNSGVSCRWNGSFTNGVATLTITGNSPGYYPVSFTNTYNSDTFKVLVIVTD